MQGARERSSTLVIPQATPPWSKVLQRDWSPGCGYADYRVTIEEGGCNPKLVGPNPPNLAPEGVENKRGYQHALLLFSSPLICSGQTRLVRCENHGLQLQAGALVQC
ncbi:hypothetical protein A9K55_003970 [Cordyceps militaris]|uniref:Uncharacterized protein n=1 Tax=Cordyceps militaris TaxID=73501 RepID=A0A2H4SMU3_CORMI|nr:hypothetical protein A9K55_003970 [Cordyceps militaris]